MSLSSETILYIDSMLELISFQSHVKKDYDEICVFISGRGKPFLKTVLAFTESYFLLREELELHFAQNTPDYSSKENSAISPEDLVEGCSYLVAIYFSLFCDAVYTQENIDLEMFENYEYFIKKACCIKQFIYAEISIGKLPYYIEKIEHGIKFCPIDKQYEKCRRAGYTIHGLQMMNQLSSIISNLPSEAVSFSDFTYSLADKYIEHFVKKVENPTRYIMEYPVLEPMIKLVRKNELFLDEVKQLSLMSEQFHINIEELLEYKIQNSISILTLIQVRRLLNFISIVFGKKLKNAYKDQAEQELILCSIVYAFDREKFSELFSIVFDADVIENFLKVFSYNPHTKKNLDLQYYPLISLGEGYFFLGQTFMYSDFIRNMLFAHQERFFPDNTYEPLVEMSYSALQKRISLTKKNYKISTWEADCISITESYVFLFEIKNTILPCNKAEERTTYDAIAKASHQLNILEKQLKYDGVIKKINSDFNTDITTKKIKKCIILGTRVLTGNIINGSPVRYITELTNFLLTGKGIRDYKKVSFWEGEFFTEHDLVNFVDNGGSAAEYAKLCHPYSLEFKFGNYIFRKETFYLHENDFLKSKNSKKE